VQVDPNDTFDPHQEGYWPTYFPSSADLAQGIYRMQFIYSTKNADFEESAMPRFDRNWDKALPDEEEISRLWSLLPKETVKSNWIEIEIK